MSYHMREKLDDLERVAREYASGDVREGDLSAAAQRYAAEVLRVAGRLNANELADFLDSNADVHQQYFGERK